MLRDKVRIIKLTLPALSSTNTATLQLADMGIGKGEQESMQVLTLTSGNYSIAKVKNSDGTYKLVVTASGSVSNNTVAIVLAQVIAEWDSFSLTKDA